MSEELTIVLIVALCVAAVLLAWLSMMLAALESAISRVTRANLNNLMIEVQSDGELSDFIRHKKIRRLQAAQRIVMYRYAASNSCAFFRICGNVLTGVLVACIAATLGYAMWVQLVAGLVVALVIACVTVLMRPRTVGSSKPLSVLIAHSPLAAACVRLTPFIRSRRGDAQGERSSDAIYDDEELEKIHHEQGKAALDRLIESNRFDPEVSDMLRNVLMLSDTLTREIMVPRTDMITIERDGTLQDFLCLCSRSGFSRVPVIGADIDDLLGMAYLKDAVRATAFNPAAGARDVESIMRKPMYVPESKPVDDLFHEMQRTRNHVAVVVDEYGGIAGMVTIEDAIEQIVGELDDEHDRTQHAEPKKIGDRTWSMPARTPITELEEIFEIDLDEDDVDTVYGLLTKLLGRVPIVGASATTHGLRLTAVDSAGRRKKVSTIVVEPASVEGGDDTGNTTQQQGDDASQDGKEQGHDDD
ncbi:hemolysin family protein [Bifidobacterium sp. AGR2158]|uniref:hemolysin family protein n=1 Tax=Bifidobacterium sp. AGR2158 TaxID=1280675 RepID=UPI000411B06B|nr:hemolysin family protein [Bifidobacterium sp. AGR2158]